MSLASYTSLSFPRRWESMVYIVFMDACLRRYDRVITLVDGHVLSTVFLMTEVNWNDYKTS